jgi:hypothetical protein
MHDPKTQAFQIKYPWFRRSQWFPQGYHDPFITVWHVDPETDGSDDSCGWSRTKCSPAADKLIEEMASWEMEHPFFFGVTTRIRDPKYTYREAMPGDCLAIVLGIFNRAAWRLHRKSLTPAQVLRAIELAVNEGDNLTGCFSLADETDEWSRKQKIRRAFWITISHYEDTRRRWWQHPRFHFWHWEFQVHPLQAFKRWAFTRCSKCKKGFKWGESPVSNEWNGHGPQWFKSENVYHCDCNNIGADRPVVAGGS